MASIFLEQVGQVRRQMLALLTNEGASTPETRVLATLRAAIQAEALCAVRYKRAYMLACKHHDKAAAQSFLDCAEVEAQHLTRFSDRFDALSSEAAIDREAPQDNAESLLPKPNHDERLEDWACEDLMAEQMLLTAYQHIGAWAKTHDAETSSLFFKVAKEEAAHLAG